MIKLNINLNWRSLSLKSPLSSSILSCAGPQDPLVRFGVACPGSRFLGVIFKKFASLLMEKFPKHKKITNCDYNFSRKPVLYLVESFGTVIRSPNMKISHFDKKAHKCILKHFQYLFIPPESIRKPLAFCCFQGV